MVWESTLNCFTTGGFGDIECIIGQGFGGMLGTPLIATIVLIIIGLVISFKLRLPPELTIVFMVSLVSVMVYGITDQWIYSIFIIIVAIISGIGYYKIFRRG